MKIIMACGGTGGHIYPGIAVGQTLRNSIKKIGGRPQGVKLTLNLFR